jgi:hypothetical protein
VWRPRGSGPKLRLHGGEASGAQLAYSMEVTHRQAGSWRDACEELGCGEHFWATSATEVEVSGMVRGGAAAKPPRMCCCGCGLRVPSHERALKDWNASGKSPGIPAGRVDSSALGHHFSRWGRHLRATILLHRALWVKTLSRSRTSDGGAFWRRALLGGIVSRDPSMFEVFLVHWSWAAMDGAGYSTAWQA